LDAEHGRFIEVDASTPEGMTELQERRANALEGRWYIEKERNESSSSS
jgi:hypothetical protein